MINLPESFPEISEQDILTPIPEWEAAHKVNGCVRDYSSNKPPETIEKFEKKFKKTYDKVTKILKKIKGACNG